MAYRLAFSANTVFKSVTAGRALKLYTEAESKHLFTPSEPITNADRIRAMTDEELAVFLSQVEEHLFTGNLWSIKTWNEWLKKEAEDD